MQPAIDLLLWFAAIGCGLIAGVYFAFSSFITAALGRIDKGGGIAAMNSSNATILGALFMLLFFGTTLASAALVVLSLASLSQPGSARVFESFVGLGHERGSSTAVSSELQFQSRPEL